MRSVPLKASVIGDMFETTYQFYGLHHVTSPLFYHNLIVFFHHEMYKQQVTWRLQHNLLLRKRPPASWLTWRNAQTRKKRAPRFVVCWAKPEIQEVSCRWNVKLDSFICNDVPDRGVPHIMLGLTQRNKIWKNACWDAKSRVILAVFRAKLGVAMTFNSLVPERKKRKAWMQFSVWRTITTTPFKVWIIYWYWYLRMDYHQRPGRDTCQSNAILRRNNSSRSACIGRVPRFYVQCSGKCWAPNITPSRHQKSSKIGATNGTGITSAVSAKLLHCGSCSPRWGFQSVSLAQKITLEQMGAMVVLGCESLKSFPNLT